MQKTKKSESQIVRFFVTKNRQKGRPEKVEEQKFQKNTETAQSEETTKF